MEFEALGNYDSSDASSASSPFSVSDVGVHRCKWKDCTCETSSTLELKNHIEKDHLGSNKGSYKCEWEDCKFGERRKIYDVKTHITLHHQHLSHFCKDCNKGFLRDQELRKHKKLGCKKEDHHSPVPSIGYASPSPLETISSPGSISNSPIDFSSDHDDDIFSQVPVLNENKKRQRIEQVELTEDYSKRERIEHSVLNDEDDDEIDEETREIFAHLESQTQQSQIQNQIENLNQISPQFEASNLLFDPIFSLEDSQELEFSEISEEQTLESLLDEDKTESVIPELSALLQFQQQVVPSWSSPKPTVAPKPFQIGSFSNSSLRHNNTPSGNLFSYRDLGTLPTFATLNSFPTMHSSNSSNNLAAMANNSNNNNNSKLLPLSSPAAAPTSPSSYFYPSSPPSSFFIPLSLVSPNRHSALDPRKSSILFSHAPPSIISAKTSPVRLASTSLPQRTSGFFPKPLPTTSTMTSSPSPSTANASSTPTSLPIPLLSIPASTSASNSPIVSPKLPELLPLPGRIIVDSANKTREKLDNVADLFQGLDLKKDEKEESVPPKPNFMVGTKPPTDTLLNPTNAPSSRHAVSLIEKLLKRM